jgi:DNA-binding GntR family transcriptional regulator
MVRLAAMAGKRPDAPGQGTGSALPRFSPMRPRTMAEQAAETIVGAAARGVFLPGDRLVEAEIARELGISRVPVREALRLLESNGIVVNQPYRGMRLMQVTNRVAADLTNVRLALELLALREAVAAVAAGASLAPLREANARFAELAQDEDPGARVAADRAVHSALLGLSGSETLLAIWEGLARRLTVLWGVGQATKPSEKVAEEHAALIDAIAAGDLARAEATLRQHIGWAFEFDFESAIAMRRRGRAGRG